MTNFRQLLAVVLHTYGDLLTREERAFADDFSALPEPAARLYVRLLCRSRDVFRLDKLDYAEIAASGQLADVANTLAAHDFLILNPELALSDQLLLLTKPEMVKRLLAHPDCDWTAAALNKMRRDDVAAEVVRICEAAVFSGAVELDSAVTAQAAWHALDNLTVLQTCREPCFDTFKLCFFGNLYQDMTEFVLRDLGLARYESYSLDQHNRAISTREQLDAHLHYYSLITHAGEIRELSEPALVELESSLPQPADSNLQRRIARLRNTIARQLERLQAFDSALEIYSRSDQPPARERRIRVLMAQHENAAALALSHQVLRAPINDEESQIVSGVASRLSRQLGQTFNDPWVYRPPRDDIKVPNTGESVELLSAAHYQRQGDCFYTENVLIDGVFGLAFWDVIFAPIKGVFFNPFQSAPADFRDTQFAEQRRDLLDQRFDELQTEGALSRIALSCYNDKAGLQNPMVNWRYLQADLLERALQRIPVAHWLAIFRRLLSDTRLHRNGLPDLILFPDDSSSSYELIEVKGPGDSLQKNQLRWMRFFADHGIKHKVCHVTWSD